MKYPKTALKIAGVAPAGSVPSSRVRKSLCCTIFVRNSVGLLIGIASCEGANPEM